MFTKIFTLLLAGLGCLLLGPLNAQNLTFEDVTEIRLQDMAPIYQGELVKGYFAFYFIDKAEKRDMANFKLILLDDNLNKIGEKKLVERKEVELKMAAYDGLSLLFVFHNSKKESVEFRRYDLQLNELSTESRFLTVVENAFFMTASAGSMHAPPAHVFPIDDKGFLFYNFLGLTGTSYKIQFIPEKGQPWKRETGAKDRGKLLPAPLCYSDKLLLQNFTELHTPSKYLQAINLETGKVVFDKEMTLDKHAIQIFHAYPDSIGNFVVVGQYYDQGDNILKSKSLGVFVGKINVAGTFIAHQYLSWEKDIAQKVKIDQDGRIDGKGNLFFSDAVHTSDGKIYLGGELYDITSRGVNIQDFVILEINADMTLNEVKIVEKKSRLFTFSGIPMTNNPEKLANYVRFNGGFDYEYTQVGDDDKAFTFFYTVREEKTKKDEKPIVKLVAVSKHVGDKNYETDIISLDSKADYYKVMPAKPGHLLFVEYYKDTKKLDMRIEKFNY